MATVSPLGECEVDWSLSRAVLFGLSDSRIMVFLIFKGKMNFVGGGAFLVAGARVRVEVGELGLLRRVHLGRVHLDEVPRERVGEEDDIPVTSPAQTGARDT